MYDLRSDTVTKPSKEVLESALDAELGDDEYKEYFSRNYSGTEYTSYYDTLFTQETNDDFNEEFTEESFERYSY